MQSTRTCGLWPHGQSAWSQAAALCTVSGRTRTRNGYVRALGTGLLAIPVLAGSSSYAAAESFKWREGLYRKFKQAHAFYGILILSVFVGLGINFLGIDPIKALIYSAVANGIVAPLVSVTVPKIVPRFCWAWAQRAKQNPIRQSFCRAINMDLL